MREVELPIGWCRATLGDVLRIVRGVSYTKADASKTAGDGLVPLLRATNINGNLDFDDLVYVPRRCVSDDQLLQDGDIVIAASSGSLSVVGKAARLNVKWFGTFGAFCMGLRVSQAADSKYVAHFLGTREYRNHVSSVAAGSNINNLRRDHIESFPIRIAPLSEQQRIVAKIEELFSDLDAGVAALERVRAKLKRYRTSVLNAAITGKLIDSTETVDRVCVGDLITGMGQGWSPRCDLTRETLEDQWGIITTTAIQSMSYDDSQSKPLPANLAPRPGIEIRVGDMLMTRKGPRWRAGVACLVRTTRPRLMVCDTVYRFRCITDKVEPAFLELLLNAPSVTAEINKKKAGINESGVSLTHQKVCGIVVPLPPKPDQIRIIEEVERRLSVITVVDAEIDHCLKRAARLRQAILKRAFEGKLVPQELPDEPSNVWPARLTAMASKRSSLTGRQRACQSRSSLERGTE